jgi:sortase A
MKKLDVWLKLMVIILLTVAAFLLTVPFIQNNCALSLKANQTTHYRKTLPQTIPTAETIHALQLRDLLTITGKNPDAIGHVVIPSVGLSDDIYAGLTNGNLGIGAVTLFPNRKPKNHNVVLIGHNMGYAAIHFGVLGRAQVNDSIYLNYLQQAYRYQISRIESIDETEIEKVKDTHDSELILVTCSAPTRTPKRILVRAKLVALLDTTAKKQRLMTIEKQVRQQNLKQLNEDRWYAVWLPILAIIVGYMVIMIIVLKKMNE